MSNVIKTAWQEIVQPLFKRPSAIQAAALCYRRKGDHMQVLLVKSSRGRWILPKGHMIKGKTAPEAARIEAWEEAGVKLGPATSGPVGSFQSLKRYDSGLQSPCETIVYAFETESTKKSYPEAETRERRWVNLDFAQEVVGEEGLKSVLADFADDIAQQA